MGRPRKSKQVETKVDIMDRIFKDLDAEVLLAGALGGVATLGGITPPLTRMLMSLGGQNDDLKALWAVLSIGTFVPAQIYGLIFGTSERPADPHAAALAASGALEAMLMMEFVKNPQLVREALGMVKDLGSATIRAGGEAVPF